MATIEITILNWDKHNPKRDQKTYSWLRLSNDITTDRNLFGLDAEQKFVWVALLCEASKDNVGKIEIDIGFLSHITGVKENKITRLLAHLEQKGIISRQNPVAHYPEHQPVTTPTDGRTNDTNDTNETDGRTEPESSGESEINSRQLFEIWNEHRGDLPRANKLTEERRSKILLRLKENPSMAYWVAVVTALAASDFATGRVPGSNGKYWASCDFDWLIRNETNHVKVSEGKYRNKKRDAPPPIRGSGDKISELEKFRARQQEREVGT